MAMRDVVIFNEARSPNAEGQGLKTDEIYEIFKRIELFEQKDNSNNFSGRQQIGIVSNNS